MEGGGEGEENELEYRKGGNINISVLNSLFPPLKPCSVVAPCQGRLAQWLVGLRVIDHDSSKWWMAFCSSRRWVNDSLLNIMYIGNHTFCQTTIYQLVKLYSVVLKCCVNRPGAASLQVILVTLRRGMRETGAAVVSSVKSTFFVSTVEVSRWIVID